MFYFTFGVTNVSIINTHKLFSEFNIIWARLPTNSALCFFIKKLANHKGLKQSRAYRNHRILEGRNIRRLQQ
jgi:hypothetical protein